MKPPILRMKILVTLALLLSGMPLDLRSQQPPVDSKELPAQTNVTEAELAKLADGGFTGQALYLIGTFIVTARGEDRAVLRFDGKPGGPRIVAVYPPSIPTPAEGAKLVRDEARRFLITDIRRGQDGQINVHVRDIRLP